MKVLGILCLEPLVSSVKRAPSGAEEYLWTGEEVQHSERF